MTFICLFFLAKPNIVKPGYHKSALLEDVEVRGILVRYEWTAVMTTTSKVAKRKQASSARETKGTFRHRPLGWE